MAILAGAFVTPAFNAFPWYFFLKGPLVGNMLSYAIVPAVCAAFIALCKAARKKRRVYRHFLRRRPHRLHRPRAVPAQRPFHLLHLRRSVPRA